ncbi:MAG: hypothetical protein AAGA18_06885, partial [Verrucomicrobiota bacterium]
MHQDDLKRLKKTTGIAPWRLKLSSWIESTLIQIAISILIIINAVVLGLETSETLMKEYGTLL